MCWFTATGQNSKLKAPANHDLPMLFTTIDVPTQTAAGDSFAKLD
jgi:hypothetical protein